MNQAMTDILSTKLADVKRMITYTGSEDESQRKSGEAVTYTTLLNYSDVTVEDVLEWADEIIKIRKLQAPLKRGIYPPKEYKVARKGVRGAVAMTDEAALLQLVQGDQARYDGWVQKYGSAKAAVAKFRELMAQMA